MQYRNLGRNGVQVSPLCLGTMTFGAETDPDIARRITDRAFEYGVNFIDTADGYADFRSEVIVGDAIRANRDKWVLATKFASARGTGPNDQGTSRKYMIQAVQASLKRLKTDYIDIYYLHREDNHTQVSETVRALNDLISQGKIRYYGLSNHRAWKVAEFVQTADSLGMDRPIAVQPLYNIFNRQVEMELLDAADHYGLGVVSYSPLARGVLTAKYTTGAEPPENTRASRSDRRLMQTEWRPKSLELAQLLQKYVEGKGVKSGQFALAWVIANKRVTAAIAGARTESQWDDHLGALVYQVTKEDEAFINDLIPPGHTSLGGFTDPAHPFNGRVL